MRKLPFIVLIALVAAGCTAEDAGPDVDRWWSNGVDEAGSQIRPGDADKIEPDEDLYCGMLRATSEAGESIFPSDIDPTDEEYVATVTAFFDEVQALAPAELQESWSEVASLVDALVQAGDDLENLDTSGIDAAAVQAASETITEHATVTCGLTL